MLTNRSMSTVVTHLINLHCFYDSLCFHRLKGYRQTQGMSSVCTDKLEHSWALPNITGRLRVQVALGRTQHHTAQVLGIYISLSAPIQG